MAGPDVERTHDLETPNLEIVNSTFAAFVEFLYRLSQLIATDPGGRERATQAVAIRENYAPLTLAPSANPNPGRTWHSTSSNRAAKQPRPDRQLAGCSTRRDGCSRR
nr:SUKH-4 family immunity protein [Asanoa ferruginea]